MKKIPLFIIVCLLVSFFSGCDEWRGSSKPEPQPKSKPEPQPEKPKSNTHTRSPSVACSADGKTVYWISNDEKYNEIEMYKSEDGGKTWVKIDPRDDGVNLFDFSTKKIPTKAGTIPRNGK
jgi:hypothetical protein